MVDRSNGRFFDGNRLSFDENGHSIPSRMRRAVVKLERSDGHDNDNGDDDDDDDNNKS